MLCPVCDGAKLDKDGAAHRDDPGCIECDYGEQPCHCVPTCTCVEMIMPYPADDEAAMRTPLTAIS